MAQDLRQFFNVNNLDAHKLGMIEFVLNSPAYEESFKPYLKTVRDSMNTLMLDRTQARKDQFPDDYLAGAIFAIDGLLKFFTLVVHETNMERINDAMSKRSPEQEYDRLARAGRTKPVMGLDQDAMPGAYDPAEDY